MDDQTEFAKLDSLLLQLALETRELAQKKDDLKQQLQVHRTNIEEKRNSIGEIQKNIEKLDEEIQQKHNTVKCYKKNLSSLRGMNDLLLNYEKTLEEELERRRDSCSKDMNMFEERIENYRKVFQQHKEDYCQNPLATKLLKIQAQTEEIKERIQALEENIMAKEKELETLQGHHDKCESGQKPPEKQEQQAMSSEISFKLQAAQHLQLQGTETGHNYAQIDMEEKVMESNQKQEESCDETQLTQGDPAGNAIWIQPEIIFVQVAEQRQQQTAEVDKNMNTSGYDVMKETMEVTEVEGQQESAVVIMEQGKTKGAACHISSPTRMTAMPITPTFSLINSPNTSPGGQERPETPTFVLSLNSGPSTPSFSAFGCGFDVGSNQHEDRPFTFTSSYFSNKKSPDTKLPGFLFDDLDSCPEEDFAFSFNSKSPHPSSSSQETGGTSDAFPFTFSFEKF